MDARGDGIGALVLLDDAHAAIEAAQDVAGHAAAADGMRERAAQLVRQGVAGRQLTAWLTELNDHLTRHLFEQATREEGLDPARACWLAFGSQGRCEQTLVTDQDNGLVFESDAPQAERQAWLALARRVNEALDRCGYEACHGEVMAGEAGCCLTGEEWQGRFAHWIDHGAPRDLLNACIYFDIRPVAGRLELAEPLRRHVTEHARRVPRFLKQMADNALRNAVPLSWRGQIEASRAAGREVLNIKLQGTMLFTDPARLYALAHGIAATGTRERFEAYAAIAGVPPHEAKAWVHGFDHLQELRLRTQLANGNNELELAMLDDLDRRMLKDVLRIAQQLQQRMGLDYQR